MAMTRLFSIVDLGVLTVAAVALFLPAREMYAASAIKGDDKAQFAVALAEARTLARPADGLAAEDLARKLSEAGLKDWAIESSVKASDRSKDSPTRWRALLAASVAYVEKVEVVEALDYANRALAACETSREKGDAAACPSWERIRMRLYQEPLSTGLKSKIDPKLDPAGFRRAGQAALRQIYIGDPHTRPANGSAAPAPAPAPAP